MTYNKVLNPDTVRGMDAAYTSPNDKTIFNHDDILTGGDVLPDFSTPVAEFF